MSRPNLQNVICYSLLALVFLLSLALRTAVPWDQVFSGSWIKFTDNDAYFYVRLLDNLARHFPWLGGHDPYFIYPAGNEIGGQPLFFVYLMGFIAWLLGGGAPSQHTVDLVGVFFPAVTGALLVFPVFFTGRAIFNKWAGLIAAGFIALIPGEFLVRTLLGNTDSHVLEIFFSTLFMLFLLLSAHYGKGLTGYPWRREYRQQLAKPLIYGALAGLCLGLYILSWQGAPLFIFISFTWLALQAVSDHLRGRPVIYLAISGACAYAAALLLSIVGTAGALATASLLIAFAGAAAIPALSILMRRLKLKVYYFPAVLIALGTVCLLALRVISPQLLSSAAGTLALFYSWNPGVTIAEMQPLLINQGAFTPALVWGNFTSASVLAALALAIVVYRAFRRGEPEIVLLAVWSVIALISALAMRRFAYYLAINAALLAGFTGWLILRLCGLKEEQAEAKVAPAVKKTSRKKPAKTKGPGPVANPVKLALGIAAVVALVVYPNTGPLPGGDKPFFDVATRALFAPSNAWCESLDWLRANTPEPFGNADYYYARYNTVAAADARPAAAYSILCWWDYGYWISRIGRRVPFSNPGSAQIGEQYFFTTERKEEADKIAAGCKMRYLIVNDYMVNRDSGFKVIAKDSGLPASRFSEIYYRSKQDKLAPTLLYYPEYYRTMAVRLYCFDGQEYKPAETAVISWEAKTGADGLAYKEITGLKTYSSYSEAVAFMAAQPAGNWLIVGKDPCISPVPLEALEGYRPAFASSQKARVGNTEVAEVKIFEYKPNDE